MTEQFLRHDPAAHAEAIAYLDDLVARVYNEDIGPTDVYDHDRGFITESFMLDGNGPSAWAWFVITRDDGRIDHAYIEYVNDQRGTLVAIPPHIAARLYPMLRKVGS